MMATKPIWENDLRRRLATLCMAAVAGKEGDLKMATDSIVNLVRLIAKKEGYESLKGRL